MPIRHLVLLEELAVEPDGLLVVAQAVLDLRLQLQAGHLLAVCAVPPNCFECLRMCTTLR